MYSEKKIGTVVRMDLLYTIVKGEDGLITKIPNSDLNYKTFSNLSRVSRSEIRQKLRFTYDTLDKMPQLVSAIRQEIIKSTPRLTNDNTLKVYFNSFEEGYLEVIVDAKFSIKPYSDEFVTIKEEVLNAIGRSAKRCNAQFSY